MWRSKLWFSILSFEICIVQNRFCAEGPKIFSIHIANYVDFANLYGTKSISRRRREKFFSIQIANYVDFANLYDTK